MPYSEKAPVNARELTYRKMNRGQQLKAKEIILTYYFSRWDNSPSDIAFLTGYQLSVVKRIINRNIVSGADLVALKNIYKR